MRAAPDDHVPGQREQLAYTASLVVVFALPSIFLLPAAASGLGLSQAVAGAWIGGNIDTTAAVSAAGAIAGEQALQLATIVKTTQNALLGVVAVALTAYFAVKVERSATSGQSRTSGSPSALRKSQTRVDSVLPENASTSSRRSRPQPSVLLG